MYALFTNNAMNTVMQNKIAGFVNEKNSKQLPITSATILLQHQHKQVLFRCFLKTMHRLSTQKCVKLLGR